jgi:hypothetical protein
MTVDEWFAAIEPDPLFAMIFNDPFRHLPRPAHGPPLFAIGVHSQQRRLRLFACAAARQVWSMLGTDARSAVLTSERYAYGRATETDLLAAAIRRRTRSAYSFESALACAKAATGTDDSDNRSSDADLLRPLDAARYAAQARATHRAGTAKISRYRMPDWHAGWTEEFNAVRALQTAYFRDIFPPPYFVPNFPPEWRTPTVLALVEQMDATGDFSALPILADALQDAGCEEEAVLRCCRSAIENHVRGNWVVDAILDRL